MLHHGVARPFKARGDDLVRGGAQQFFFGPNPRPGHRVKPVANAKFTTALIVLPVRRARTESGTRPSWVASARVHGFGFLPGMAR
jgi:hypothetical protein